MKLVNKDPEIIIAKYKFIKHYIIVLENTSKILNYFILFN